MAGSMVAASTRAEGRGRDIAGWWVKKRAKDVSWDGDPPQLSCLVLKYFSIRAYHSDRSEATSLDVVHYT